MQFGWVHVTMMQTRLYVTEDRLPLTASSSHADSRSRRFEPTTCDHVITELACCPLSCLQSSSSPSVSTSPLTSTIAFNLFAWQPTIYVILVAIRTELQRYATYCYQNKILFKHIGAASRSMDSSVDTSWPCGAVVFFSLFYFLLGFTFCWL